MDGEEPGAFDAIAEGDEREWRGDHHFRKEVGGGRREIQQRALPKFLGERSM